MSHGEVGSSSEVSVEVTSAPPVTSIVVRGELDYHSKPILADAIERVWSEPRLPQLVRMDLSRLWFIDTTGLALLLGAQRRARELGAELVVDALSPPVARVFATTGLAGMLAEPGCNAPPVSVFSADWP